MHENIKKKKNNIKKKKKILIFVSGKVKSWCNYILNILLNQFSNYEIFYNTNEIKNMDIIITHIKQKVEYFSEKAINIVISGENYNTNHKYDISISTLIKFNSFYNIYLPFLYASLKEQKLNNYNIKNTREKFCAFMYSYNLDHRIKYFNLLSKYLIVDGIGKSCNNINLDTDRKLHNNDLSYLDEAIKIYSNYKFVLAIENKYIDGYFTEKIINPLIANSIPIYWGSDYIFNFINKKRIIYIPDYENESELLNKIKEINEDNNLYNNIINQDIYIKGNNPIDIFNRFENNIHKLFN